MRPVRLDLDGFATFRSLAVIDFTDADFFALVGATGAGKSTVIDAITFALYGTVPRWNDQRMITPALAPTATRGVVRLIFDADGRRYAVARQARRSGGKTSRVTMHASRLERLLDPEDLDGATDVLAADSEVTGAVEQLLGLSYQHFTTCVALPQGRFAEFLHAKASDRQDILSSLLGYQLYDDLHGLANSRARDHRATVTALDTTLANYTDTTDAAVAKHITLADRLNNLQSWVIGTGLPALDTADEAKISAHATLVELTARHTALTTVQVPDDVADLDGHLTAATNEQRDAQAALAAAERDDRDAVAAVAAFRPRFELQTLQQQWNDVAEAEAELPDLITSSTEAKKTHTAAKQQTAAAEQTTATLRQAATEAAAGAAAAEADVAAIEDQLTALAAITTPETIAELANTLAELDRRRTAVEDEATQADDAYVQARAALNTTVGDSVLETGLRATATLTRILRADLESDPERQRIAATVTNATDAVARAQAQQASEALEDARRADIAGALRLHLHSGESCPVCEQPVTTVPHAIAGSAVAEHETKLAEAQAVADSAEKTRAALDGQLRTTNATRAAQLAQAEIARTELTNALTAAHRATAEFGDDIVALLAGLTSALAPETPTDTLTEIAATADQAHAILTAATEARQRLADALAAADRRRDDAAAARRSLERDTAAVEDERSAAAAALHTARDTVSTLSPPAIDASDLATAWRTLTMWAAHEHATRVEALAATRRAAVDARTEATDADSKHTAAADELTRLRSAESAALQALTRLTSQRDDTSARQQRLRTVLVDQPDPGTVTELLTELDTLDAAATQARTRLEDARTRHDTARPAFEAATAAVAISRNQLAAARDPLTRYGAPALTSGSLATAWTELTDWATAAAKALTRDISTAQNAADKADDSYADAVTALSDRLASHQLHAPATGSNTASLRSAVATTAARAAAAAQAAADNTTKRLAERHRLESERATSAEQAQVAGALAQLLRSDGFRAWLLESALASLVADASAILFDMSSGQFELTTTGRDLEVIDHNDADSHRPVRTLSGGETFQASLALALALSRQVATLAASGAAKLESIFLDEGFGTLDETSLDVVAGTLETLASSGERMVGVITHVPALAERIPVRFQVTRTGHSSTITRIGV